MNRSNIVIKNTIWELGYYLFVIILGFLAPRYIILAYGSAVNGLSSTVTQILNIILILQAGATTASIYSLYKPVADNDLINICKNVASAEYFFRKISLIFGAILLIVSILAPFTINSNIDQIYIFCAFMIMGLKSFLDLYFTAKFRIVFTAYQEKFYISIATLIEQIVYYILVFATIFARAHFILLYIWFLLGGIVKVVYLELKYKQKHANITTKGYKNNAGKIGGRNYALANEISHSVMNSSITILLSFMYSLKEASVYSIYALVSQALNLIASSIYSSFAPSFGNMVAQDHSEHTKRVFHIFQYIFLMMNTFLMMCMSLLIIPFVRIYTNGIKDISYENFLLASVMVIGGMFSAYRIPYNVIVSTCGYFKETWLQPVISVFICIGISILFGSMNYALILLGSAVFYAVNFLYQYFKIKKLAPQLITPRVFSLLFISFCGLGVTFFLNMIITVPSGIIWWIVFAIIYSFAVLLFIIFLSLILDKEDFKESVIYLCHLIQRNKNNV